MIKYKFYKTSLLLINNFKILKDFNILIILIILKYWKFRDHYKYLLNFKQNAYFLK